METSAHTPISDDLGVFILRSQIAGCAKMRDAARKNKDWFLADTYREILLHRFGVEVVDTPSGTLYRLVREARNA